MTREEEIRNFIKDSGIGGYKYDDLLGYNEYGGGDILCAFIEGAEWADSNPINVWHDASEEPEKGKTILVEVVNTIPPKNEIRYFVEYVEEWIVGLMKIDCFKCRWAYVSDLLPKGCEW